MNRGLRPHPPTVRAPAVAGRFYPGDPRELAAMVDHDLAAGRTRRATMGSGRLIGVVAPHAGYVYSGPVAGAAYALLDAPVQQRVRRVLLLGPAHYVPVRGIALPSVAAFETPLGELRVADDLRTALALLPGVVVDDYPHEPEHSLEVQLPFLQRSLGEVEILPGLVGSADAALVAGVLAQVWGDPKTLVVVSTDLSHYCDLATARRRDAGTAASVVALDDAAIADDDACGARPLRGLLRQARRTSSVVELVDLATSADSIGPPDRVVGYGAFAVREGVGP